MSNEKNLKPFAKGDSRINRKGRPKSFDALRRLALIAGEELPGSEITRIEAMLKLMSISKNPKDRALFLLYAYGKPKDEIELSSKDNRPPTIRVIYDDKENNSE